MAAVAAFKPNPLGAALGQGWLTHPPLLIVSAVQCRSGVLTLPMKKQKLTAREGRCLLSASSAMPQICPFRYCMSPMARGPVLLGAGRVTPDSSSVMGHKSTGQRPGVGPRAGAFASAPVSPSEIWL